MKPIVFSMEMTVPQTAIDSLGHVNNVIYLEWVQEVSSRHWAHSVSLSVQEQVKWIVLSHFISYKKPAFQDEVLVLSTWVEKFEGVKSERHVEIRRKKDDQLLVKTKTLWCLVDSRSRRPKRLTPEMEAPFFN